MQQTALNLVAIGIFGITFLSLLTPFINIPPSVPAGMTLVILVLGTIDTLAWQNRGVTLFLDFFASDRERERVLHHEAGHFLVAYLLDIPVTGYTLTAWEAFKQGRSGNGGVIFDTDSLPKISKKTQEISLITEKYCKVFMAGIAAEKYVYGAAEGGKDDRAVLRSALRSLGLSQQNCLLKERTAQLQATTLIEENKVAYQALVSSMKERKSVQDCYEKIETSLVFSTK